MPVAVERQRCVFEGDRLSFDTQESNPSARCVDILSAPPILELGRNSFEFADQFPHIGVLPRSREITAEARQHGLRLALPCNEPVTQRGICEQHPEEIAPGGRVVAEAEELMGGLIVGQNIPAKIEDMRGMRRQVVEQSPHQRWHGAKGLARFGGWPLLREKKEMTTLGRVELEDAREIVEEIRRNADLAALFEPCVPAQADAGERRYFLASQTRRAPPPARR